MASKHESPLGGLLSMIGSWVELHEGFWFIYGDPRSVWESYEFDDKSWRKAAKGDARDLLLTADYIEGLERAPQLVEDLRTLSGKLRKLAKGPAPAHWPKQLPSKKG